LKGAEDMQVCIINTERNHKKRYQIMVNNGTLFEHLYPGKLFDLGQAIQICGNNNYQIKAIGTMWHCLNKE
jgi:hypothetical protein